MFSAPSGIPLPPMIARMLNGSQGAVTTTSVAGSDGAQPTAAPDGAQPAASQPQPATAATEPADASSANGSAEETTGGARRCKLELPALEPLRALADGAGAGTLIESAASVQQQMQGAVLSELASSALELLQQELQGDVDLSRDDLPLSRPTHSTLPPRPGTSQPSPQKVR